MSQKEIHNLGEFVEILKRGADAEVGDGMFSYVGILRKYVRLKRPKRILEWGAGISTVVMAVNMPNAEIVTIEHDLQWYMYWLPHFQELHNVKMYPLKLEGNYVEAPLALGKFDLIFVDGVDATRPRCLEVAAQVLNVDGVVLVHDSERLEYWPPIERFFRVIDESERKWNSHTVVLELKK